MKICPAPSPKAAADLTRFEQEGVSAPREAFTVATWNINGLPLASRKNPAYRAGRELCQSELLQAYDINAVQERFMPHPPVFGHRASDNLSYPRIDWLRMRSDHHGLAFISQAPMTKRSEGHYAQCSANLGDCWARKGWLVEEVQSPTGPVLLVTTHMDAGRHAEDKRVRATQVTELLNALKPFHGPMVLLGDLNFSASDAEDQASLNRLVSGLGLTIAQRENGKGHDVLASRGVEVLGLLQYDDPSLTDHPLMAARIRARTTLPAR